MMMVTQVFRRWHHHALCCCLVAWWRRQTAPGRCGRTIHRMEPSINWYQRRTGPSCCYIMTTANRCAWKYWKQKSSYTRIKYATISNYSHHRRCHLACVMCAIHLLEPSDTNRSVFPTWNSMPLTFAISLCWLVIVSACLRTASCYMQRVTSATYFTSYCHTANYNMQSYSS